MLNQIGYAYDAGSRLNTVTSGPNTATYGYLPNSPLVGSITFKQSGVTRLTTTKSYDNLNRLSSIVNTPSSALPAPSYSYNYNSANQRTKATREDNAYWDYTYDALGQVTSGRKSTAANVLLPSHDFAWTYDDIGNRKTDTRNSRLSTYTSTLLNTYSARTVPGSFDLLAAAEPDATVTYQYPAASGTPTPLSIYGDLRYAQLTANNSATTVATSVKLTGVKNNVGPNGEDAVTELTRGVFLPKTPEVFTYDADGNLTADAKWIYAWDGENRLIRQTARAEVIRSEHRPRLVEFAYDGHGRRVQKRVTQSPDYGVAWKVTYYDQPFFAGLASPPVDYGALNLVNVGGGGIMSAVWEGKVTAPATGSWTFKLAESAYYGYRFYLDGVKRFEAWPELGAAQTQSVTLDLEAGKEYAIKLEFSLRHDWRWWMYANVNLKWSGPGMAEQLVPAALSSEAGGSDVVTTTRFIYDGWNLLTEVNDAGAAVRAYAWGLDLSGSAQGAGGVGGLLIANLGSATHAPSYDGNGNVIAYVDMATGAKSATYEYSAFGETLVSDGPAAEAMPFMFSTKYTDVETGHIDFGLRIYIPSLGRFANHDPIEENGGSNLYGMLGNNPIDRFDVLGLFGDGRRRGDPSGYLGHSDFPGGDIFDYTAEDHDPFTSPFNPVTGTRYHFQDLQTSLGQVRSAITTCNKVAFERKMHRLQDYWTHYNKGYRSQIPSGVLDFLASKLLGDKTGFGAVYSDFAHHELGHALEGTAPDEDNAAWQKASNATSSMLAEWNANCVKCGQRWIKK